MSKSTLRFRNRLFRPKLDTIEDRITPGAGSLDLTFNGTGKQIIPFDISGSGYDNAYDSVVQPDGRTVVVGISNGGFIDDYHALATRLTVDGQLDPSFGVGGRVIFQFEPGVSKHDDVRAVALQGNKILIGGTVWRETPGTPFPHYNEDFAVTRLNEDGSIDTTFGTNGLVTIPFDLEFVSGNNEDILHDMVVDSQNRIVLAGHAFTTTALRNMAVVRLTPDGQLDTTFDGDGKVTIGIAGSSEELVPLSVAVGPTGQILLGGHINYYKDNVLVMLTDSGAADPSFGTDGRKVLSFSSVNLQEDVEAMTFDSSGKIIAVGVAPGLLGNSDGSVFRLLPNGELDTTFNGTGLVRLAYDRGEASNNFDGALDVFVDDTGKIVVGGYSQVLLSGNQTGYEHFITRILPSGQPDSVFGTGGTTFISFAAEAGAYTQLDTRITPAPGGKIVLSGSALRGAGGLGYDFAVARINGFTGNPPTISDIPNQSSTGSAVGPLLFTIGDAETPTSSLTLSAQSSNGTLVPNANITFGGSGANRTVTVTPVAGLFGTATITITVTDLDGDTASDTFTLTVNQPINTPPTLSSLPNQLSNGSAVGPIGFTVGDAETPAASLIVSAVSSNQTVLPNANIQLGGSGTNRTITLNPAVGQLGTSTVTITVKDAGNLIATKSFDLTVSSRAVLIVNSTSDSITPDGFLTLREAIQAINVGSVNALTAQEKAQIAGDVAFGGIIQFASSVSGNTISLLNSELIISSSMDIDGGAKGITLSRSTANGTPDFRILDITQQNSVVNLRGLTISNGRAALGGGIINYGALTISQCMFIDNKADNSGGGLTNFGGTVFIRDSVIRNNTASGAGGGIDNYQGMMTISNSTINNNSALSSNGGGIDNNQGTLSINNSTIHTNTTLGLGAGGGIDNFKGTVTVNNSTISGNTSAAVGGGFYSFPDSKFYANNATITANRAKSGGGFSNDSVECIIRNTIVSGNFSGAGSVIDNTQGVFSGGNILYENTIDAKLGPLQNNGGPTWTHALLSGSPAIDAGSNSDIPNNVTLDQNGQSRIRFGAVDIGAFERQLTTIVDSDAVENRVAEGAANGTLVGLTAHSGVGNVPLITYSLVDDAGGRFVINSSTGIVSVAKGNLLNAETNSNFTITIQANDGFGSIDTQTFTIAVANVNPSTPTDIDLQSNIVVIGSPTDTKVGITASSVDPNGPDVTFSLTNDAGGQLSIDPATGIVHVTDGSLLKHPGQFTITVQASDGKGGISSADFEVTIKSPPNLIGSSHFSVGSNNTINFYNSNAAQQFTLTPFSNFNGGLRTASSDFNGDGIADVVVGTGPGGATHVKIFDGLTKAELFSIDPFETTFTGGIFVAAGDINGDGKADLAITPDEGGGPRCRVFSGNGFIQLADFFGIDDPNFRGGARAAIGDMNGDGKGDLQIVAGFGGGPRVAAYDGSKLGSTGGPKLFNDFFAFEQSLRNGIFVASGDVNGDGFADLVAGGGPGGGPRVYILDGKSLVQTGSNVLVPVGNFFAGNVNSRGGVRVAVKDLDGDNNADIIAGSGTNAGSRVTAYLGKDTTVLGGTPPTTLDFNAFSDFTGGVFVG